MLHKTVIGLFISAALVGSIETAVAAPPLVVADRDMVSVTAEDQTLRVSLADAVLTLESPQGRYVVGPALQLGKSWIRPSRAEGKPRISKSSDRVTVEITCPVLEQRQFTVKLEAYAGIPAVFVTSRLEVLADPRTQYYFWGMNFSPLQQVSPGQHGFERMAFDGDAKAGKTIPWNRWWYLGSERGGLAVLPTNCGGRSPGKQGSLFLHALPRSQLLAPGDSLNARFGLAGAKMQRPSKNFGRPCRPGTSPPSRLGFTTICPRILTGNRPRSGCATPKSAIFTIGPRRNGPTRSCKRVSSGFP